MDMPESDTDIGATREARFRVADWLVEPALGRIKQGHTIIRLEPKVMEVLVYLASRPGEVVSRRELETSIWAGTVVGYDAVTGSIQKLRKAFEDSPRAPQIIETLAKRGYRLVAPVRPADTAETAPRAHAPSRTLLAVSGPSSLTRGMLAMALVIAAVGVAVWLGPWRSGSGTAGSESSKA